MKIIKRLVGIILLAFLGSWFIGFIQINGATFDIKDAAVTTYWDYDDDDEREPYEIVPTRSVQIYEDGYVGLRPDFQAMLNQYIQGERIIGISSNFNDGKIISSEGTDHNICLYPENLTITKTRINPFHNSYKLSDKNIFEFESNVLYYGNYNNYFQSHSYDLEIQVEVNGIHSKSYLDYKLKEIYLYYMLDALRQHVKAENQFLKGPYFDNDNNYLFVKDNLVIGKEDFLTLDPKEFASANILRSLASMSHYTDDADCDGVWIATSK